MKFNRIALLLLIAVPHLSLAEVERSESVWKKTGFKLQGGASWNFGKIQNKSLTLPARFVNSFSLFVFPALRFANWRLGPIGDFNLVGQLTYPQTVRNTNVQGYSTHTGVALGYIPGRWEFIGSLRFLGSYVQSLKTSQGTQVTFKNPIAWRGQIGYRVDESIRVLLNIDRTVYHSFEDGELKQIFENGDRVEMLTYGFGASYVF